MELLFLLGIALLASMLQSAFVMAREGFDETQKEDEDIEPALEDRYSNLAKEADALMK